MNEDKMAGQATQFMQDVAEEADRMGDSRCVAICQYALGTIKLWQGDSIDALDKLKQSLRLHNEVGSPAGMAYTLARRAVLHTSEGATDLGWVAVQDGLEYADQAAVRDHCLQRLYGVAIWNRMEAGDAEKVAGLVTQSEALLENNGACTACSVDLYPWLALYYLEQGEIEKASACADQLRILAAKTGSPIGEASAHIVRCGVQRTRGDMPGADASRDAALNRIQGTIFKGAASPITRLLDKMTV